MPPQPLPPRPPIFPFSPADAETPRIRIDWVEQQRNLSQHPRQAHAHQFPQIIYCEQDGGSHRLGTRQWNVRAGDLFLIAPYEIHDADTLGARWVLQFTVDTLSPGRDSSLRASEAGAGEIPAPQADSPLSIYSHPLLIPFLRLSSRQSGHVRVARSLRPKLTEFMQSLHTELHQKQAGYNEAARAYLMLLLIEIARLSGDRFELSFQAQPLLSQVFQFIETHYTEPISSTDVARAVERSSAYLTTLMRRHTGRTVLEWLTERRMAEARRLLLETDEPLSAICSRIGYRDRNHFIRLFRRYYQTTPGRWRSANR